MPEDITDELIESLVTKLTSVPSYAVEANGIIKQFETIGDRGVPLLQRAIKTASSKERCSIALALGSIGTADAVAVLVNQLRRDRSVEGRRFAVFGLTQISRTNSNLVHEQALDALCEAVHDKSASVRSATACLMGCFKGERVIDALLVASKDNAVDVATSAIKALSAHDHPVAPLAMLDVCRRAKRSDWNEYDFFGDAVAVVMKARAADIPSLISALHGPSSKIRAVAAGSLGSTKDPSALNPLLEASRDRNKSVGLWAVVSLASFDAPEAIEAVSQFIKASSNIAYVMLILNMWRENAHPRVVAALVDLIIGGCDYSGSYCSRALGTMGPAAVDELIKLLSALDANVREAAAEGLGASQDIRSVEPLRIAVNDENERVRESAVRALRELS